MDLELGGRWRRLHGLLVRRLSVVVARLDRAEAGGQVGHQTSLHGGVQTGKPANFTGAFRETSAEFVQHVRIGRRCQGNLLTLECFQVFHRHLQNIRLLQLRVSRWL